MASIRRTQSPAYHDRPYPNGQAPASPIPVSSSSYKVFANGGNSSGTGRYSSSQLLSFLPRLLGSVFHLKPSRRVGWRRPFYRCLLFFSLGFLLGMAPFSHVEDVRDTDGFSFEIKPPHVNVRSDDGNKYLPADKREEFMVDTVSLAVDTAAVVGGISARLDFVRRKQIIVVTPTYNRAMQAYFLHRMGQMLRLVQPPVLWIVVESKVASFETAEILRKTGVMYRHLVCNKDMRNIKDRGVHQRNTALEHIELHRLDGIVYFADDDNIYSRELFQSLREIKRFGTWPIAMLAPGKNKAILEGPVCNGSHVIGWHTNEKSKRLRRFHVDMSGFAFNSSILWDPKRWHRPFSSPIRQLDSVKEGFQETTFIEQVVEDESQMEGVPSGCSTIMNWHLHLHAGNHQYPNGWLLRNNLEVVIPVK